MKKQTKMQTKRAMPAFATEAAEAQWWFDNRSHHGQTTVCRCEER